MCLHIKRINWRTEMVLWKNNKVQNSSLNIQINFCIMLEEKVCIIHIIVSLQLVKTLMHIKMKIEWEKWHMSLIPVETGRSLWIGCQTSLNSYFQSRQSCIVRYSFKKMKKNINSVVSVVSFAFRTKIQS